MDLSLHLFIHLAFSALAGFLVWRFFGKPIIAFVAALFGGFFIDSDHLIDYWLSFGFSYQPEYFFASAYTLKSEKIFYLFHGWEYMAIFLILGILIKKQIGMKIAFLAIALGMLFHLAVDVTINEGMTLKSYSIIYRAVNDFDIEKIITDESYQKFQLRKEKFNL